MATMERPKILWEHPDKQSTQMWDFKTSLEQAIGKTFADYEEMYDYSCNNRSDFWLYLFKHMPIVYSGTVPRSCVDESAKMDTVPKWFPGVNVNFAQNCLFVGDSDGKAVKSPGKEDDKVAVTEVREGSFNEPIKHVTWSQLREKVGRLSQAMRAHGVKKGDRVALVASTCIDTLTVFLASTAIGALFSSSSTDMGTKGILDRLLQIRPVYLFMDDFAIYNGKKIDLRDKMKEVVAGMESVSEFKGVVSQSRFTDAADISSVPRTQTWSDFLSSAASSKLEFEPTAFSDPFLIVYSSGTTGTPKCIVHAHGGVVLNGHKEQRLHRGVDHTSTQLQYTTTGWIMYNSSVQALLPGARMITYDGSPFLPNPEAFIKLYGESQQVTHLGISPRYLSTLQTNKIVPKNVSDISNLKVVTSTGMVLPPSQFAWFYSDQGFPSSVHLDNISGGTDLAGCFATGNPLVPVYADGGCQSRSLGYPVQVYDALIEASPSSNVPPIGQSLPNGEPGELVSPAAFPTMPIQFYGPDAPQKYFNSYFARFRHVWTHGDFISIHPITHAVHFLGRADGVLNPSGVRFGSAEIYGVIDTYFADVVADSICVGQRRPTDNDERVVLFLLMKPGKKHAFTPDLIRQIKAKIGRELSRRHTPKFIFETPEIPTTVNLKKVELPVKQIISGKTIKPSGTLLNPACLDFYYRFAKDENLVQIENGDGKPKL